MLDLFIETADKDALKPGMPQPAIVWFTRGEPKFMDLAILVQGIQTGQVLRVVSESRSIQSSLEVFCDEQGLRIVGTNEEKVLTQWGCYSHYYIDIERLIGSSENQ